MLSLRHLLFTIALLLLTVSLGVRPTYSALELGRIAVQGTDNGVYLTTANLPGLYPWGSMAGRTSSSPSMCNSWVQGLGGGYETVVVRGTDNSIYAKPIGWAGSWFSLPAGATHLQPVCAFTTVGLSSTLHALVVGTDYALYYTNCAEPCSSNGSGWSAWQNLGGSTNSVPALVASTFGTSGRLDLLVRGTDNGIYHKAYTNGAWASSWDRAPGGATPDTPAGALWTDVAGCNPICVEYDFLIVVVRGTDNGVYWNVLEISPSPGWGSWSSIPGVMKGAPVLASDPTICPPSSTSPCSGLVELVVRGTDNSIYHKTFTGAWSSSWDTPLGTTIAQPAFSFSGVSRIFTVVVAGSNHAIYFNRYDTGWHEWISLGGATNSGPAVTWP